MQLEHISYHVPDNRMTLHDLNKSFQSDDEIIALEKIMGLKSVCRDDSKTPYDNVILVVNKFLKEYSLIKSKVKYILFSHTGEYIAPFSISNVNTLMRKMGFIHAICFGSTINKCATVFHFMQVASTLFLSLADDEYILILQADTCFTSVLQVIPGSTVMGDAASVILLSKKSTQHKMLSVMCDVDHRFHQGVFGTKENQILFQTLYVNKVSELIKKIVTDHHLSLSDIKMIFPHNVNVFSWKRIAHQLLFPQKKIYLDNVAKLGHCFGSDPFMNVAMALSHSILSVGDYYLLVSVGLGATFSVMLCQY